jgi:hypothetical protein
MILSLVDFFGGDGGDRLKKGEDRLLEVERMEANENNGLQGRWRGWRGWRR